jgi:uncharacterized membrane protein
MTIRNPVEWTYDFFRPATWQAGGIVRTDAVRDPIPEIRKITLADLGSAVTKGFQDFGACRTDVLFIGLIYPLVGLVLAQLVIGGNMLPLVFPLIAGFALLGPAAGVSLYEMSRRREQGLDVHWTDSFGVMSRPNFGAIAGLALILAVVFFLWLASAMGIYWLTMGPEPPASIAQFARDVVSTPAGWELILVGCGVGFVFALAVLAIGVFSFPVLIDRNVSLANAVKISLRAVKANPVPMLAWGFIVAASLALGALPLLLGLIVVVPILGHTTWHLYRKTLA